VHVGRVCVCVCVRVMADIDVRTGFVGCIESLQINNSHTAVTFDLTDDSSENVLQKVDVGKL